jgi:hypothetical protein
MYLQSKFKFTFQLSFWDAFKQFEETPPRRAANLAQLLAHLVLKRHLSLSVIKVIEVDALHATGALFLKVLFHTVSSDTSFNLALQEQCCPSVVQCFGYLRCSARSVLE